MSPITTGLLGFAVLMVLLLLRVHIGVSLLLVGLVGILATTGSIDAALKLATTSPYFTAANFDYTVVPLFVLMGNFAIRAEIGGEAFDAARKWLGRLPGGLAIATVWSNALFGAACGSAVAAASVFTKISLPEMRKQGYDVKFACGTLATGSILSPIIPPSIVLVIFGILTGTSIAGMLLAGVLPGLLLAGVLSALIYIMVVVKPALAPREMEKSSWKERIVALRGLWGIIIVIIIALGGIYAGVLTPTEAGAVGAFGTFVIVLIRRKLTWRGLFNALLDTAEFTSLLFLVVIGAGVFARFLTLSAFTSEIAGMIVGGTLPPMVVLSLVMLVFIMLGCFIDGISILVITMPAIFPAMMKLGFDPIWFGLVCTIAATTGLITPPFGLSVFAVKAAAGPDIAVSDVFQGCYPFIIGMLVMLLLVIAFPQIALVLPNKILSG